MMMLIACITLEGVNPICHALDVRFSMRMMIAFITLESSLVPLMHDLCCSAQFHTNSSSWHHEHIFLLFFPGKLLKENKQLVQELIPPPSINIHTRVLRMYPHVS